VLALHGDGDREVDVGEQADRGPAVPGLPASDLPGVQASHLLAELVIFLDGLIIPTGKRKGQAPSVASIYRALAEHDKKEAYPEAVAQAHADFADLQDADDTPRPRRTRIRRPADLLTPEEADLRQRLQDQVLRSSETE